MYKINESKSLIRRRFLNLKRSLFATRGFNKADTSLLSRDLWEEYERKKIKKGFKKEIDEPLNHIFPRF